MLDEFNFESMQEECLKGGMSMFKTKYLGDNLVLLSPKAEGRMEELVKLHREWFYSIFADIKPWSMHDVVRYKRVWVRCYGLSFQLWSNECLSKVMEEVAMVVGIDEATLSWDCLEYARCQVRLLKSCKANFSKEFRINGRLYNITVVEEAVKIGGGDLCCKCAFNHEGSSDSVSSVESFMADSLASEKFSEEEDGSEARNGWRLEKVTGGGEGRSTVHASKVMDKECSEQHKSCQQKRGLFCTRKDLCMQGVSAERTCVSDTQKRVSEACATLHHSMVNLVEVVEAVSNSRSRPICTEAQSRGSCIQTLARHCANRDLAQTQMSGGAGLLSTAERTKGVSIRGVGTKGDATLHLSLEGIQNDVATNRNEAEVEDEEVEAGNEEVGIVNGKEGVVMEEARITLERVRHLRALWEKGTLTVQRRCRLKGGLGSLHQGNSYSTRLSSKTYAMSDSEIVECNNRLRREATQIEATRLREVGKRLGTTCSRDAGMLIKEMETLEDRDNQVLSKFKEGIRGGIP